jgi:uncharacterized glyoxalase superfamily protein PhnB
MLYPACLARKLSKARSRSKVSGAHSVLSRRLGLQIRAKSDEPFALHFDSERLKAFLRPLSDSGVTVTKELIEQFFEKEKEGLAGRR